MSHVSAVFGLWVRGTLSGLTVLGLRMPGRLRAGAWDIGILCVSRSQGAPREAWKPRAKILEQGGKRLGVALPGLRRLFNPRAPPVPESC